jgi:hypothetical protein
MEWLIIVALFAVVAFVLWGASRLMFPPAEALKPATKPSTPAPRAAVVRPVAPPVAPLSRAKAPTAAKIPAPVELDPAQVADLRDLPSARYRIKGSAFVVTDANRERFGGTEYQLRREPKNRHDAHAIAIYGQGHKVGYISAAKAASIAPLLDELPEDAFTVGGAGVVGNSIRLWVDVPSLPALRRFVKARTRVI